jgi:hypothetical protein
MRKELKRVSGKAKKEYLECTCHKIMEFQGRGPCDIMYMKMKELGCKKIMGFKVLALNTETVTKNWGELYHSTLQSN